MGTYRMENGDVVKTENATGRWTEETYWDGRNHISKATGTQWDHQTLYRSRKGRYYVVATSQWQGSHDRAEWVSPEEAARWLAHNGHEDDDDIPEDIRALMNEVTE